LIRQISIRKKLMASDDEKIKTNSAPENEVPPEKKSTSGAEASKADGGESVAASPPGYTRNPFLKLIGITGT
jgi:hypothetical protein